MDESDRPTFSVRSPVQQNGLEVPGIEPGASHMRSERSTTELHPQDACTCAEFNDLFDSFIEENFFLLSYLQSDADVSG